MRAALKAVTAVAILAGCTHASVSSIPMEIEGVLSTFFSPPLALAQPAPKSECMVSEDDYYGVGRTRTEAEKAYRRVMRQKYPDMNESDFAMYVQYGLKKQRERVVRRQATCIRLKGQYPNLSREEREVLLQDEMAKYEAAEQGRGEIVPEAPPVLSCTQMRMGSVSSIDCY